MKRLILNEPRQKYQIQQKDTTVTFEDIFNKCVQSEFNLKIRDYSLNMNVKFSGELIFLTPWYAHSVG